MRAICLIRVSSQSQDLEQQSVKVKQQAISDGYRDEDIIMIEDIESAVKLSEEERNGLNKMKMIIERDSDSRIIQPIALCSFKSTNMQIMEAISIKTK